MTSGKNLKIAMVAGETSGDVLGAGLISELSRRFPNAKYFGIGGPRMQSAGLDVLYEMDRIELMGLGGLFESSFSDEREKEISIFGISLSLGTE